MKKLLTIAALALFMGGIPVISMAVTGHEGEDTGITYADAIGYCHPSAENQAIYKEEVFQ